MEGRRAIGKAPSEEKQNRRDGKDPTLPLAVLNEHIRHRLPNCTLPPGINGDVEKQERDDLVSLLEIGCVEELKERTLKLQGEMAIPRSRPEKGMEQIVH
jgi:hypothetical protein